MTNMTSSHASHNHHHHHHHHGSGDGHEQEALLKALTGNADKGSRVTLIGLAANIALTAVKGIAGYLLSSASLIADAGHSFSDLLGDLITLFAWNWSRRPKDKSFPFGYGKFESVGSLIVAFFLISGGLGIGFHSYTLLLPMLSTRLPAFFSDLPKPHSHHHAHEVDIRASYFALLSILVKESLYRLTYKVGKAENSNVLIANALHHRSDAFSSFVALLAIVGSSFGLTFLDPLGGFIVCSMILSSGFSIGKSSLYDLLDKRTDTVLDGDIANLLMDGLKPLETKFTVKVNSVRHLKIGPEVMVFVELGLSNKPLSSKTVEPDRMSVNEWVAVQQMMARLVVKEKKNVKEVFVKFNHAPTH